jgi:hypothetical protein
MAAGAPVTRGKGQVNGTFSVLTFNTTSDIPAGDLAAVVTTNNGGSLNVSSITVGSLSLSLELMGPLVNTHIEHWSAVAVSLIPSGSTVTITLPGTVSNSILGICCSAPGVLPAGYADVSVAAAFASSSTPVSGTTATTALPGSMALATIAFASGAITVSAGGGYTEIDEINDATGDHTLQVEYLLLPATGTQQAGWTLSAAIASDTTLVVDKPSPTGALQVPAEFPSRHFSPF